MIKSSEVLAFEVTLTTSAIQAGISADTLTVACLQSALRMMMAIGMDDEKITSVCAKALTKIRAEYEELEKEGKI